MKKFLPSVLAIGLLALASCSKTPQVTITLYGFTDSTVVVAHTTVYGYLNSHGDSDPLIQWDTLTAQNSVITLTPADSTSLYAIVPMQSPGENLWILVSPDDRMNIRMKFNEGAVSYTTEGTPVADAVNDYNRMTSDIKARIKEVRTSPEATEELFDSLFTSLGEKTFEWTKKHLGNPATALYIQQLPTDSLIAHYDLVSKDLRGSEVEPLLKNAYDDAKKYAEVQKAKENIREGADAPDFTLQDNEGKAFTFSSLRGRWAVLDFWGTWCGWCVKGIPDMKEAQAKHADKCQFVSIDCGDSHEKWMEALEKYQMPWTHVYVPADCPTDVNPGVLYAVQGYPTKIIVDPNGKIAKIVVGESPEFYEALDQLVK